MNPIPSQESLLLRLLNYWVYHYHISYGVFLTNKYNYQGCFIFLGHCKQTSATGHLIHYNKGFYESQLYTQIKSWQHN